MRMFSKYLDKLYSSVSSIHFDTLMLIIWGSFGGIFVVALIACLIKPAFKATSKRPFLCLVNAYAAVTLAAFLLKNELPQSILAAALFWCAGYLLYGVLCLFTKPVREEPAAQIALSSLPVVQPVKTVRTEVTPAKSSVRLEHAISVTDKLLGKNLGKSDRQELEKLKNTLAVLQMKGTLSPTESDILNDNFNALLKLMAKYNV